MMTKQKIVTECSIERNSSSICKSASATLCFSLNYFTLAVRIEEIIVVEPKLAKDTLRGWY